MAGHSLTGGRDLRAGSESVVSTALVSSRKWALLPFGGSFGRAFWNRRGCPKTRNRRTPQNTALQNATLATARFFIFRSSTTRLFKVHVFGLSTCCCMAVGITARDAAPVVLSVVGQTNPLVVIAGR